MFMVTEFVDYLDPNPEITKFDSRWEADDYLSERILQRVDFEVQHSAYEISESEYDEMIEYESSFFIVKEVDDIHVVDKDGATD